jgi:HD-GYP domain-containing protein (c-di-GMP phosphodiesterase class II)
MTHQAEHSAQVPLDRQHFTRAVTELGERRPVITTRAILNTKGSKVVEAGIAIKAQLYERLMQHHLDRPLEDSVMSIPAVTGVILREQAVSLLATFPFFSYMALDEASRARLLDTLEALPLPPPVAFQLTLAYEVKPALFEHSVLTSLLAAWFALDPGVSTNVTVSSAAAAGLLHDIGLLHLDPVFLGHGVEIDQAQRRQLYSHPLVSTLLVEVQPEYSPEVARGIKEHHEFLDGSGYPAGLTDPQICSMGRILALTELIAGSFGPDQEAPLLRLSVQLRMNTHRYDEILVEKALHVLPTRPEETMPSRLLLKQPLTSLLAIDEVLATWPSQLAQQANLPDPQQQVIRMMAHQVWQIHRTLARVGVTPVQLAQLGTDALDIPLQTELTLLAREAAWQLSTLAREAARHWSAPQSGSNCPPQLKEWVARVVAIASEIAPNRRKRASELEEARKAV